MSASVEFPGQDLAPVQAAPGVAQHEVECALDGIAYNRWLGACQTTQNWARTIVRRYDPSEWSPEDFREEAALAASRVENGIRNLRAMMEFYRELAERDIAATMEVPA